MGFSLTGGDSSGQNWLGQGSHPRKDPSAQSLAKEEATVIENLSMDQMNRPTPLRITNLKKPRKIISRFRLHSSLTLFISFQKLSSSFK